MRLQDYMPSPALQNVVERYWAYEEADASSAPCLERVLPSPVQPLLVVLGSPAKCDGAEVPANHREWVIAPVIHRQRGVCYAPPVCVFGVLFRLCGFYQLLGVPITTGLAVEADSPLGRFGQALAQHVMAAANHTQRVAAAEAVILAELRCREAAIPVVERLISSVLQSNGQVSVDEMAQKANLSRRQLERRFREAVGVPPKLFAEMNRFGHVFRVLHEQPLANWSDVTHACGYFDQAHFIREFRRFTGETPGAYFAAMDAPVNN